MCNDIGNARCGRCPGQEGWLTATRQLCELVVLHDDNRQEKPAGNRPREKAQRSREAVDGLHSIVWFHCERSALAFAVIILCLAPEGEVSVGTHSLPEDESMAVSLTELQSTIRSLLRTEQFKDYAPNGLQVEGKPTIEKIVSGVTASRALIEAAIDAGADALLVHHGYFWRGEEQTIVGIKRKRIELLLNNQISLLAYHLPLDAHAELGNNVQLGRRLGLEQTGEMGRHSNHPIGLTGRLPRPMNCAELAAHIGDCLGRDPLIIEASLGAGGASQIESIAWCTGAAQSYIDLAVQAGVNAYLTGEISEPTVHIARESGVHFISAGHHATERYGVQALAAVLADKFDLAHQFIDIDNPV